MEINILQKSHSESLDFEDGNWLETEVKIVVPGFKDFYGANLRTDDFARFNEGLERLRTCQSKEVEFTTMEEGIYLKGTVDMSGNIKWIGKAKSPYGNSCLTFVLETDYASIDDLLRQMRDVLNDHPVIGIS